jgi:DNA integrity scanning protein DisA with diadenylate cyclase activity
MKLKKSQSTSSRFSVRLGEICNEERNVNPKVLKSTIELAIEISREGREGRKIGTLFTVGDEDNVLAASRSLILDPLKGHPLHKKKIDDPNMRETIKELAQLDGAFIVSDVGNVLSAARYIDADSKNIELPLGLGSRHVAAASITLYTNAVAVVVSESSVVRVLDDGKIIAEIIPELWLIQRASTHIIGGKLEEIKEENIAIVSQDKGKSK